MGWSVSEMVKFAGSNERDNFHNLTQHHVRHDRKFMWWKFDDVKEEEIMFKIVVNHGNVAVAWFSGRAYGWATLWLDGDVSKSVRINGNGAYRLTNTKIVFRNISQGVHDLHVSSQSQFALVAIATS